MKDCYEMQLKTQKEVLFSKYRKYFQVQKRMALANDVITFTDSVEKSEAKGPAPYATTAYVKVPCNAQATFSKLFYRIARQEGVHMPGSTLESSYEELKSMRRGLE